MENPAEDLLDLDGVLETMTSKLLVDWNWRVEDHPFEMGHGLSPQSMSSGSSFESTCSSPEMIQRVPNRLQQLESSASSDGASPKSAKPKMSTKRRVKASEREKMRMRSLADALHHLRDYLPADYSQRGQPLTKIQTLKCTIQYINELSDLLRKT
ncbi:MSGN1 protein, partial [Amia calva]|nr:MSGN1 protein [Amia calva]